MGARNRRDLLNAVARGIGNGAVQLSATTWEWHCEADCQGSFVKEEYALTVSELPGGINKFGNPTGAGVTLTRYSRCNKCENCLRHRRQLWTERAKAEIAASARTWFGTLTLNPEEHSIVGMKCTEDTFENRHRIVGKYVTDFLKRIRKGKPPIRFMLVAEAHKLALNGLPHYHMLIHEVGVGEYVHRRELEENWRFGFTKWKLLEDRYAAPYLCKYLSKSAQARVRASLHYGSPREVSRSQSIAMPQRQKRDPNGVLDPREHYHATDQVACRPAAKRGPAPPKKGAQSPVLKA